MRRDRIFATSWRWSGLFFLSLVASLAASSWKIEISPAVEYRLDRLKWDSGCKQVNVMSELTWRDLRIIGATCEGECLLPCGWLINAQASFGKIFRGRRQDSDFWASNRQDEYARCYANTTGYTVDFDLGIGPEFTFGCSPGAIFIPAIGYAYHRQSLRDRDNIETIELIQEDENPSIEPCWNFYDGDSTLYSANWHSVWIGYAAEWSLARQIAFCMALKLHGALFHGYGDWVQRPDIAYFTQLTTGIGIEARLGLSYQVSRHARLTCEWKRLSFSGYDGKVRIYRNSGDIWTFRSNAVRWRSTALALGLNRVF